MVYKYNFLRSYQMLIFLFAYDTKITTIIDTTFAFCMKHRSNTCTSALPIFSPDICRLNLYTYLELHIGHLYS